MNDKLLNCVELAKILNTTPCAVRAAAWRKSDAVPPGFKRGRSWAWSEATVQKWLASKNTAGRRLFGD